MKDWKTIVKKIFFPPMWVCLLLVPFSAATLVAVFMKGWEETPIAYVIYVVSFYTLVLVCLACWKTIPGYYKNAKEKVYDNKYANRYLTDVAYKTRVNLYRSLFINLAYVLTNAVSGIIYQTPWFGIFAGYYAIMALLRFLLIRYVGKNEIGESRLGELKRCRACSWLLLTVNLILSGVILMMVYRNKGFEYQGILIYVMAMYTFYITGAGIADMVRYRKYKSPVMYASVMIRLTSSLFSMLFLETAMFAQFGQETAESVKQLMIMLTGAGISIIVVTLSIYMIVKTTKEIRSFVQNPETVI